MDISAVSLPTALSLKMCNIFGIVFCDFFKKKAHFGEAEVHLCSDHAASSASWFTTPVRQMEYIGKEVVFINMDWIVV